MPANFINVGGKGAGSNSVLRKDVKAGQVFRNAGGQVVMHTGVSTIPPSKEVRYQGLRLDNRDNSRGETTLGKNGNSKVEIVGTYTIDVKFADAFKAEMERVCR